MADVIGRERGQMLLIASLIVATSFVGLALVVNGAIYTENLSTRETSGEAERVAENRQLAADDLQELIDRSNAAVIEDNFSAVENGYNDDLAVWSDSLERQYQRTGRFVEYRPNGTVEGTHIQQTNASRNFTAGGSDAGKEDWTLVDDTTRAGEFEMVMHRSSLLDVTVTSNLSIIRDDAFNVLIENETGSQWRIYFFRDPLGNGYLMTEGPNGFNVTLTLSATDIASLDSNAYCPSSDTDVSIDVVNATFGGERCPQLGFYTDDVTGTSHNISYRNTKTDGIENPVYDPSNGVVGVPEYLVSPDDRVTGTYNLTVNKNATRTPYYAPTSGDDPNAKAVIYEASVDAEFRSESVVYRNENLRARWSEVT